MCSLLYKSHTTRKVFKKKKAAKNQTPTPNKKDKTNKQSQEQGIRKLGWMEAQMGSLSFQVSWDTNLIQILSSTLKGFEESIPFFLDSKRFS